MMKLAGEYFCGNKISEYGIENGFLDYATLAKSFDAVLNNNIMQATYDIGYWDKESGFVDNSEAIEELQEKIEELDLKDFLSRTYEARFRVLESRVTKIEENLEWREEGTLGAPKPKSSTRTIRLGAKFNNN